MATSVEKETRDPGPDLPQVEMHLHNPKAPGLATVVRNEVCTSRKAAGFVRHIELDVSGTELAGRFRAGQSFGVLPPGEDARGRPHQLRLYSIASPTGGEDGEGKILATTVKRTIDEHWDTHELFLGVCSNYLCDLKPGDEVRVTGPNGKRFLLPERPEEHDYVFIATGTGIAPFRGMVRELLARDIDSRIVLVMGSPYTSDLLYHDELRAMAEQHERFTYLTAISRELQEDGGAPRYVDQRLTDEPGLFRPLLERDRGLVYLCGIAGMELGVFRSLKDLLGPSALERYLQIDPEVEGDPRSWTRKMVNRQLKPSRRMFLEVY
ncbi:MAG: hypothetical protein AAGG07_11695 [Planctomycetota bacterium]